MLSLPFANAGGLEKETASICLRMLHGTTVSRNSNVPALSKWCLCHDMKQFTVLNT